MILTISDNKGILDLVERLHPNMIFVIVLLLIFSPVIMSLTNYYTKRGDDKRINHFLFSFKTYLTELQDKLDVLLELLYERHANNLTLEMSKKVIELVYERTSYKILLHLTESLSNRNKYKDGNFDTHSIKEEIDSFIKNRYYSDVMILNKASCKNITLHLHLLSVDPNQITIDLLTYIKKNSCKRDWEIYKSCQNFFESYYTSLTNKAHSKLEEQVKSKI